MRTVVVAAISLAAVIILNLFVTIPGMTHLAFLCWFVAGLHLYMDFSVASLNIDAPVKNTVGSKMIWAITGIGSLKFVEYLI